MRPRSRITPSQLDGTRMADVAVTAGTVVGDAFGARKLRAAFDAMSPAFQYGERVLEFRNYRADTSDTEQTA